MMYKIIHCLVAIPITPYLQPVQGATWQSDTTITRVSCSRVPVQSICRTHSSIGQPLRGTSLRLSLLAGIVEAGSIDLFKACLARYAMPVPI